ncbi:MAG TPA: hypothetical protein VFW53_07215 [Gallionella sp.]|nr:hypothetical protein [Gallionella sp.]
MHINLHFNLGMPRAICRAQKRANKAWRFIGNYFYYRKRNHSRSMAWKMARDTF